ncbi:ABC transporter ATP-binding protein [Nostoc sp. DedQUE09]|uniref:ABC transporter ATP-binding protein n=1 Tax=Nostoc sp. DedQUE09 TaxID=3075394 RepID=UPI002AD1DA8E|nr:ABC transporter ATP-binding protein [Nostoc sp. DedQUE09]MDZ7949477.1 ABC transporter ATP-binding protein [Nostoc sp. DedQUE09]
MADTVVKVENLSKSYVLSHQQEGYRYKALRDVIADRAKSLFSKIQNPKSKIQNSSCEEFWALKDVSFEIKQGDRIGIIGRNGAGKSTLLKILSRIVEPTKGSIEIQGRVASLLEVGTGFHPELTGRENIFLNGAILGMSKKEITRKFDEIVNFAEIEKFLDTPVKRYSSGMYVRLAFAVAAHLEPEILIVDEVLAVGDVQFQKKCLGKMQDVGKEGRTVIFVSHNMGTIQSLCSRCILLNSGLVIADDIPASIVQLYLENSSVSNNFTRLPQKSGKPSIVSGEVISQPQFEDTKILINLNIHTNEQRNISLELRLSDNTGITIGFGNFGIYRSHEVIELKAGLNFVSFTLSISQLAVGSYFISLDLALPWLEIYDRLENCLLFEVVRPAKDGTNCVMLQSWGYGSVEIPLELKSYGLKS